MSDVTSAYVLDLDAVRFTRIGARLDGVLTQLERRYGWTRDECEQFALDCISAGVTNPFHVLDLARACERGYDAYLELLERVA